MPRLDLRHSGAIFLTLLFVPLLLIGCGGIPDPALGTYDSIQVIHQNDPPAPLMDALRKELSLEFTTFQQETLFYLYPQPARRFADVENRKNLLFLVDLSDRRQVTGMALEALGGRNLDDIVRGEGAPILFVDNLRARGQSAAFVLGNSEDELLRTIEQDGNRIRAGFLNTSKKRIFDFLTFRGENKTLTRRIYSEHHWHIRMPAPFTEDPQYLDEGFFTMNMDRPGRLIFVYWRDGVDELPGGDQLLDLRHELGMNYYEDDAVERSLSKALPARFQGRPAIRLEGLWQDETLTIGGPFRSLAFIDEDRSRLFLIDWAVYIPGESKKYYLWELESVIETFSFDPPPFDDHTGRPQ